jgi:hypothetical protein
MARDLRRYARQTHVRLLAGGLLLLFIVGDGLIALFYGRNAAILGFLCLLGGLSPLVLIWLILEALSWIAHRTDQT